MKSRTKLYILSGIQQVSLERLLLCIAVIVKRGATMTETKTDLPPRGSKLHATMLLHKLGQSLWLDNITRDLLESGTL